MDHSEERSDTSLRFLFWNVRSFNRRKQELQTILQAIDICICVESWLTEGTTSEQTCNFPGFVSFRQDRLYSRGGGLLLLVRKNIAYVELSHINHPDQSVEMCGIHIRNIEPQLNLIVCYRAPGLTLTQSQWDLVTAYANKNLHCILVGDFNAHNQIWNCCKTDTNGDRFFNSLEGGDLYIHNVDSHTYIDVRTGTKSNIDLVISTLDVADKINGESVKPWFVNKYLNRSQIVTINRCNNQPLQE